MQNVSLSFIVHRSQRGEDYWPRLYNGTERNILHPRQIYLGTAMSAICFARFQFTSARKGVIIYVHDCTIASMCPFSLNVQSPALTPFPPSVNCQCYIPIKFEPRVSITVFEHASTNKGKGQTHSSNLTGNQHWHQWVGMLEAEETVLLVKMWHRRSMMSGIFTYHYVSGATVGIIVHSWIFTLYLLYYCDDTISWQEVN